MGVKNRRICKKVFGDSKGGSKESTGKANLGCAPPLAVLESPRTIREVLGGSLHTFSPERKYGLSVQEKTHPKE
jgi:hypothetical protein